MTDANKTEIICILDRSGSMQSIAKDMEGGFDAFMNEQAKQPGHCAVSLVQFDTKIEDVYVEVPVERVPPCKIEPRGGTALLDAIGFAIGQAGGRLAAKPEHQRPGKVIVLIVTDGHENASREHSFEAIANMVKQQKEKYSWDFVFLGTTEKALDAARGMGIENKVKYSAKPGLSAQAVFSSLGSNVSRRRAGQSVHHAEYQKAYDNMTGKKPSE